MTARADAERADWSEWIAAKRLLRAQRISALIASEQTLSETECFAIILDYDNELGVALTALENSMAELAALRARNESGLRWLRNGYYDRATRALEGENVEG